MTTCRSRTRGSCYCGKTYIVTQKKKSSKQCRTCRSSRERICETTKIHPIAAPLTRQTATTHPQPAAEVEPVTPLVDQPVLEKGALQSVHADCAVLPLYVPSGHSVHAED